MVTDPDPPPGTCSDCKGPTPMRGIERCLMCRIKREKAAMAEQRPVSQAISEWSGKRYNPAMTKPQTSTSSSTSV